MAPVITSYVRRVTSQIHRDTEPEVGVQHKHNSLSLFFFLLLLFLLLYLRFVFLLLKMSTNLYIFNYLRNQQLKYMGFF